MNNSLTKVIQEYKSKINLVWDDLDYEKIENLALDIVNIWKNDLTIYICGNGGSATNANHLANDLIYGVNKTGRGIKIHSLCANDSILTCLANDTGYENIFSKQLRTLGSKNDLLICLSGSGKSQNIYNVLKEAQKIGMKTHGFFGFNGGSCLKLVDNCIHFKINDMQVSEDFQMIVGHILTKYFIEFQEN